ncbi:uncharacterized protein LOC125498835 [Beta vulgaris subsp. vulgaris]|uniref:uncharacterized protein LOC125498835 n=1 Tax=Beta vulgaris subsp. vulgaris TaxID=3555 RepID=UPI00203746CB|nr:uncharacterized protein LOC125498835 [Beta vulgaris subsp. vulgaris]
MKLPKGVINPFVVDYLRQSTPNDLARLLRFGEDRGLSDMIGSIDYMHGEWKNCPWKGQSQGRDRVPTLVLEAFVDWDVLESRAPPVQFTVNDNQYVKGYYLTDGIYPNWATFIQSLTCPQTHKDKLFSQHQEGAQKVVKSAFGVLQSRFAIVRRPSLAWD